MGGDGVILERETELSQIAAAIERAGSGTGGALLIEGPAGIGKTVLLRAGRERARSEGFAVLTATARESERDFGYGVVRQLFEPVMRAADPPLQAELLSGAAGAASAIFDEAAGPPAGDGGFLIAHGLYWLVANLAERQPVLLAVDDVHSADAASLQYVLPRLPELPVLALLLVLAETDVQAREHALDLLERATAAVTRLGERAPRGLLAIVALERALTGCTAAEAAVLAERALAGGRLFEEQGPDMPHAGFAAAALVLSGRDESAEHHLGAAVQQAQKRGSARGYAFASAVRAWARCRSGRLSEAEADAHACLDLAPGRGWELFRAAALSALVDVLVERDRLGDAVAALAQESEVEAQAPGSILTQPLRLSIARLAMARGRPTEALKSLHACAEWERAWGACGGIWVPWRSTSALAHAELGERERAADLAQEELGIARRFGAPRQLGMALRALGLVCGGDKGTALLRDAVAALEGSGAHLEHGRALLDLGAALRRRRQPRESREPLRRGLELAHGCGAAALAARARDELAALGIRPRGAHTGGIDALTARERRVAELAAQGLTNPEIAQTLFVTRKTVEAHLRSIFRKLDLSSRRQLRFVLGPDDGVPERRR